MLPLNYLSSCYLDSIIISLFYNQDDKLENLFFKRNITPEQLHSCYSFKRVSALNETPLTNFRGKNNVQHYSYVSDNIVKLKHVLQNIISLLHNSDIGLPEVTQEFLDSVTDNEEFNTREKITAGQNDRNTPGNLQYQTIKNTFPILPRVFTLNEISKYILYFRILLMGSCTSSSFSFRNEDAIEFLENFFEIFGIVGSLTEIKEIYDTEQETTKITPAAFLQKTDLCFYLQFTQGEEEEGTLEIKYFLKTKEASLHLQTTFESGARYFDIVDYSRIHFFFIGLNRQKQIIDEEGNIRNDYHEIFINADEKLIIDGKEFFLNSIICGRPGHYVCYIKNGNDWYFFNDIVSESGNVIFSKIGTFEQLKSIGNVRYHPFRHGILFMYKKVEEVEYVDRVIGSDDVKVLDNYTGSEKVEFLLKIFMVLLIICIVILMFILIFKND